MVLHDVFIYRRYIFFQHFREDLLLHFYACWRQCSFIAQILFATMLWKCWRNLAYFLIFLMIAVTLAHMVISKI